MADLAGRHARSAAATEAAVAAVLRSGRYIGGPVVAEAEAMAAALLGRRAAVGVNSGTDALILGLQALGVRPGDEVIVPALSFFATAGAVCAVGARPVIVDVTEDALLDADAARDAKTARTTAVIPVHLFGNAAPIPRFGVPVLDDAAQAAGCDPPCPGGDLSALSTYPTKLWGGAGDGGFVAGEDEVLLARVRALGSHGATAPDVHERVGGAVGRNSRLDAIQAAVLVAQRSALEGAVARRRSLAAWYDARLPSGVRPLPRQARNPVPTYVISVPQRDAVVKHLTAAGVESRVYYPRPLGRQPALEAGPPTPVAERLAASLLALPCHEGLSDDDAAFVLDALSRAVR